MFEKGSDITHQTWNKHSSSDYSAHKALYSVCQKPLFSPYPQFPGWPDGEGTFASLRQTLFPKERHICQSASGLLTLHAPDNDQYGKWSSYKKHLPWHRSCGLPSRSCQWLLPWWCWKNSPEWYQLWHKTAPAH